MSPGGLQAPVGFHVAAYLAAPLIAVFIGGRPRMANRLLGLFDLTAVAAAVTYLGYQLSFRPALARHAGAGVLIGAVYPELDALVLIVAVSVGVDARSRVPLSRLLVTMSFVCLAGADIGASDTAHVDHSHGLLMVRAAPSCLIVLAGPAALRHRETDGPVRKLPSRWSMAAVFAVTLNVLHTVASAALTRQLIGLRAETPA